MGDVPFAFLHEMLNFEKWKEVIGQVIWWIVSEPIKLWLSVPWYIRYTIYLFFVILSVLIVHWSIKHKDDIYRVRP